LSSTTQCFLVDVYSMLICSKPFGSRPPQVTSPTPPLRCLRSAPMRALTITSTRAPTRPCGARSPLPLSTSSLRGCSRVTPCWPGHVELVGMRCLVLVVAPRPRRVACGPRMGRHPPACARCTAR
jgi:hypothetical protein